VILAKLFDSTDSSSNDINTARGSGSVTLEGSDREGGIDLLFDFERPLIISQVRIMGEEVLLGTTNTGVCGNVRIGLHTVRQSLDTSPLQYKRDSCTKIGPTVFEFGLTVTQFLRIKICPRQGNRLNPELTYWGDCRPLVNSDTDPMRVWEIGIVGERASTLATSSTQVTTATGGAGGSSSDRDDDDDAQGMSAAAATPPPESTTDLTWLGVVVALVACIIMPIVGWLLTRYFQKKHEYIEKGRSGHRSRTSSNASTMSRRSRVHSVATRNYSRSASRTGVVRGGSRLKMPLQTGPVSYDAVPGSSSNAQYASLQRAMAPSHNYASFNVGQAYSSAAPRNYHQPPTQNIVSGYEKSDLGAPTQQPKAAAVAAFPTQNVASSDAAAQTTALNENFETVGTTYFARGT